MFATLPDLFVKFFPYLARGMARQREVRCAERAVRRRQAYRLRPRLEALEDRIVLDAYVFEHPNANGVLVPSSGAWSTTNLWWDLALNNGNGGTPNQTPGAKDTADIPTGASCTLTGASATVEGVTVEGGLTVGSSLTVEGTPSSGTGITSIASGGVLTIGNPSNPNAEASLDTQSFLNSGTATVGGPNGGSSGTLDTVTYGSPTTGSTGTLDIGAPGSGQAGTVDVSETMNISGTLTVGGAGGSGGTLDVYSLTATSLQTVNANGTIDVKNNAAISGTTTIAGGVINADHIDAQNGATVAFGVGPVTITTGPLTGNLNAEENASFTFGTSAAVTLGSGATLGDGKYTLLGALTVDTNLVAEKPEFTLAPTGSIGGTGSIAWYNNEFD
jgi:hypothetical protein